MKRTILFLGVLIVVGCSKPSVPLPVPEETAPQTAISAKQDTSAVKQEKAAEKTAVKVTEEAVPVKAAGSVPAKTESAQAGKVSGEMAPVSDSRLAGLAATDYPWWRGRNSNDVFPADTVVPTEWGENKNIVWKTPIPGRGHATPILVGETIYLPTATNIQDKPGQVDITIMALSRKDGKVVKTKVLRSGKRQSRAHNDNSDATATIACDGKRLFFPFVVDDQLYFYCCDLNLEVLWTKEFGTFVSWHGFATSPIVYNNTAIFCFDQGGGPCGLVAYDPATGREIWKTPRAENKYSYVTPALLKSNGKDLLIINGPDVSMAYDPATGKKLWEVEGPTDCCPSSAAWDSETVYLCGGWPKRHIMAARTDGSSKVLWTHQRKPLPPYVCSMLVKDGLLYTVADEGVLACLDARTGKALWSEQLSEKCYSSPILIGDRIYLFGRSGTGWIYKTGPKAEKIAENKLGTGVWATPVPADGGIYLRSLDTLYFISAAGPKE